MPSNRNTRTQRKTNRTRGTAVTASAPATWAMSGSGPEVKYHFKTGGNFQLYHNVGAPYQNVANQFDLITQGTGGDNRIGNRLYIKRFSGKLVLNNKVDRPNVSYRFVVVATPSTTSTDTYGELFLAGNFTSMHSPTMSILLHDVTFPQNQGSSMENNMTPNKERSFTHSFDIPINKAVAYNTSDGLCNTRLLAFVIAYDAYGTLTSDNIASVAQTTSRIDYIDA